MAGNVLLPISAGANAVFSQVHFRGRRIGYGTADNWTFNGCLFNNSGGVATDFITDMSGKVTQNYCTFRPVAYTMPPGNNGTVTTAATSPGTPCAASWQSFTGDTSVGGFFLTRRRCNVWGDAGMQDIFGASAGQGAAHGDRLVLRP